MILNIEKQGLICDINSNVRKYMLDHGYQPEYGARPIRRLIQSNIMPGISKTMLKNPDKKQITISYDGGVIFCS